MKNKFALAFIGLLLLGLGLGTWRQAGRSTTETTKPTPTANKATIQSQAPPVPAHYDVPPSLGSLKPTLAPEGFIGVTKEAYQAAREIPETLAQLPCYCHCDKSMGHKSLHSCFEDDHASHCAVCVAEALTAYRLQKEQRLSAAQIRDRIITQYSQQR
jgi:hypothetical protein